MKTILLHLKANKRKTITEHLKRMLNIREKQKDLLLELGKPLDDNIRFTKETLKGKHSIEFLIKHNVKIRKYYSFLEVIK